MPSARKSGPPCLPRQLPTTTGAGALQIDVRSGLPYRGECLMTTYEVMFRTLVSSGNFISPLLSDKQRPTMAMQVNALTPVTPAGDRNPTSGLRQQAAEATTTALLTWGAPMQRTRPPAKMAMRWHRASASSMLCVVNSTAVLRRARLHAPTFTQ